MAASSSWAKSLCGKRQDEQPPEVPVSTGKVMSREEETQVKQLFTAIEKCELPTIKKLVKELSVKEVKDMFGRTALHILAEMKPEKESTTKDDVLAKIFHILIKAGCDVNCGDANENTPVKLAAEKGSIQVLKCLLDKNADMEKADKLKGDTPLHRAAMRGMCDAANLLLQKGAARNPQNKDKQTPLHLAVEERNGGVVRLLIMFGADKTLKDKNDYTPSVIARRHGHADMESLLKKSPDELKHWTAQKLGQGNYVEADSGFQIDAAKSAIMSTEGTVNYFQKFEFNIEVKEGASAAIGPDARMQHIRTEQIQLEQSTAPKKGDDDLDSSSGTT